MIYSTLVPAVALAAVAPFCIVEDPTQNVVGPSPKQVCQDMVDLFPEQNFNVKGSTALNDETTKVIVGVSGCPVHIIYAKEQDGNWKIRW